MVSLFHCLFAAIIMNARTFSAAPMPVVVTWYLRDMDTAPTNPSDYLYYYISICQQAIQSSTQAQLTISLPDNPGWDTSTHGFVMAQVSTCKNSFTEACVIAQNYKWGAHVNATSTITWNYNGENDFYIRLLAENQQARFSMELEFLTGAIPSYYNWTTYYPFSGSNANKSSVGLYQYWKSKVIYTVFTNNIKYFELAYCQEDKSIMGIDIAVTTPPDYPNALITAWACPQSIPWNDCTQSSAQQGGWVNYIAASFSLLQCPNVNGITTSKGIYIGIEGVGGSVTRQNQFTFQATTHE